MKGAKSHSDRLRRLADIRPKVRAIVYAAADELAAEAAISITSGTRTGRKVKGERRKEYIASAPGEPPAYDTETLSKSIHVELSRAEAEIDDITATVLADAPYAASLEFGTSKMSERPFMRPAARRVEPKMQQTIRKAIEAVSRGHNTNGSK